MKKLVLLSLFAVAACGSKPVDAAANPKTPAAAPAAAEKEGCWADKAKAGCCGGCANEAAPVSKPVEGKQQ